MKDIFDELNNINDDIPEETWTGTDVIEGAYILIVDDAKTFDTTSLINQLKKEYEDEDTYPDEFLEGLEKLPTPRIIIDKNDIDAIIENIAIFSHIQVSKHNKNLKFKSDYKLSDEDIRMILKQLRTEDYNYSLESTHEVYKGTLLHVFITGKLFKVTDKILKDLTLYIKFEYNKDAGAICIVSIHPTIHEGTHPYKI